MTTDYLPASVGAIRCIATVEEARWIIDTWSTRWGTEQVITLRHDADYDDDAPVGWGVVAVDVPATSPGQRLAVAAQAGLAART